MEQKHTPGPWTADGQYVVAQHDTGWEHEKDHLEYYGGHLVAESIAFPANARLIAAAPDLLTACKAVAALIARNAPESVHPITGAKLGRRPSAQQQLDILCAAIAKATGAKVPAQSES